MRKIRYFFRGRLFPCTLLFGIIAAGAVALAIWLPRLLAPVALVERALSFAVALAVIAEDTLPEKKAPKLLLLFLPWMGAALCLFFYEKPTEIDRRVRPDLGHGTLLLRVAALSESLCSLPHGRAKSVLFLPVGRRFYESLLEDLKGAKQRIWLEFYIVARGVFWGDLLAVMEQRAAQGVDVRLIYDDFGCAFTLPEDYAKELGSRGIRTAVFRRLKVGRGFSRRDHRKLAIVDGICYTGGANLADEYIGEAIRFGHWKDCAVRIEGGTESFCELFLRTWYALRPSDGIPKPQKDTEGERLFVPLADGADGGERLFPYLLADLAANARRTLYLTTPYLSLPRGILDALTSAARSGTDVRVLIPHIPDKKPVFFVTRAYARELLRRGIAVREYTPGFLHAKCICADSRYAVVSSYNLDFRSLYVQAECGAFFEDEALAEDIARDFLSSWEQSAPPKRANALVRALGKLCMLFAPLT